MTGTSSASCGTGGAACTPCEPSHACIGNVCTCQPNCPCKNQPDGCGGTCSTGNVCPTNNAHCDSNQNGLCVCNSGFDSCGRPVDALGCNCKLATHYCAGLDQCVER